MMAAGGAVELMVSMLHTQEYTEAPSSGDIRGCGRTAVGSVPHPAESSSSKGDVISEQTVPHQVRGSVQHFNHILPVVRECLFMCMSIVYRCFIWNRPGTCSATTPV